MQQWNFAVVGRAESKAVVYVKCVPIKDHVSHPVYGEPCELRLDIPAYSDPQTLKSVPRKGEGAWEDFCLFDVEFCAEPITASSIKNLVTPVNLAKVEPEAVSMVVLADPAQPNGLTQVVFQEASNSTVWVQCIDALAR